MNSAGGTQKIEGEKKNNTCRKGGKKGLSSTRVLFLIVEKLTGKKEKGEGGGIVVRGRHGTSGRKEKNPKSIVDGSAISSRKKKEKEEGLTWLSFHRSTTTGGEGRMRGGGGKKKEKEQLGQAALR